MLSLYTAHGIATARSQHSGLAIRMPIRYDRPNVSIFKNNIRMSWMFNATIHGVDLGCRFGSHDLFPCETPVHLLNN